MLAECQIHDEYWESGYDLEEGTEAGLVRPLKYMDFRHLNIMWRRSVLSLLRNMGKMTDEEVKNTIREYPKGFFVYQSAKAVSVDSQAGKKISAYLLKPAVTSSKVREYSRQRENVVIRYKMGVDGAGKNVYRFENMTPEEFIRRVIRHILPHTIQKVRYYGFYSNKYRGCHTKESREMSGNRQESPVRTPWRKLMWKIIESDPLVCLNCGEEMVIRRIIMPARAAEMYGKYTRWKYCVEGRWRIDRRAEDLGPPEGLERRLAS